MFPTVFEMFLYNELDDVSVHIFAPTNIGFRKSITGHLLNLITF